MAAKYLDDSGLAYFWSKLKAYVSSAIAGSSAGSAARLSTARTISSGDLEFQGSASFDGSADVSLNVTQQRCVVRVGGSNSYPYHRIAYTPVLPYSYTDHGVTFLVCQDYAGGGYGVVRVVVRTNNVSASAAPQCEVEWLARSSLIDADSVQVGFGTVPGSTYVDVFYKCSGAYRSAICRVLAHSSARAAVGRGFSVVEASVEDGGTVSESYASLAAAGTALHGRAYDETIAASNNADVVHISGSETITGDKTFTSDVRIANDTPSVLCRYPSITRGTPPNSDIYNFLIMTHDKDWRLLCGVQDTLYASGATGLGLYVHNLTLRDTDDYSYFTVSNDAGAHGIRTNSSFYNVESNIYVCRISSGTGYNHLYAGQNSFDGATLQLFGRTHANYAGRFYLRASTKSSSSSSGDEAVLIGIYDGSLKWNGQTVQTSSDERLKTPLSDVSREVLDAWAGVRWGEFKFLDAVERKGDGARLHVGLVAQAVDRVFEESGLDACAYGILCHDVRDAVEEERDVNGNVVLEGEPASDLWMVRYTEALCMEAAYMRRENARLKKRVADLEDRLAALELRLGSE